MGLFNTGKNDKVEKVDKCEEQNDSSPQKSPRRSSKHHSKKAGAIIRPMPQSSLLPFNGNYISPNIGYPQGFFGNIPQYKFTFPSNSPFDLSKFVQSSTPFNPFGVGQTSPANFGPVWSNGMSPFNDRSPFQQQQQPAFNMYQQNGWPYYTPSTNGYMPPMNF
jgi:hypothetical protein